MQNIFTSMRRLHDRGPACRGLGVDEEGVALGPECMLVRRTPHGYQRAGDDEIVQFAREAFGDEPRLRRLPTILAGIAQALNTGDLVRAQLLGLEIPLGALDDTRLKRVALASLQLRKDFNPDQPRDNHGRWTSEGRSSSVAGLLDSNKLPGKTLPEAGGSFLGPLASDALIGLGVLALRLTAATVIFRILFIPSNRSLISEGPVPNHPDMTYRYDSDTGELSFYREGERRKPFFIGSADPDGIFRDGTGQPIARKADGAVIVDLDALPSGAERATSQSDEPKLCPAPTDENISGRSEAALRYQEQISGLPRGVDVELNGVRFDGCRLTNGNMLEAKGPGYEWAMISDTEWREKYKGVRDARDQMRGQSEAAPDRIIEWHFAEERVAKYFRDYAARFSNVRVFYTPPETK